MPCKEVANRWKEKWQTGGREKCHSTAKPSEVVKVWSIRPPSFCVDCVDSVPNLPRPMKIFSKKAPGSFIHKLYGLRSPDPHHRRVGEPDYVQPHWRQYCPIGSQLNFFRGTPKIAKNVFFYITANYFGIGTHIRGTTM